MPVVLGIHSGHHAACAVVRDGVLVSAIEQERITRIKHDGQEGLSNRLPIVACLEAARVSLSSVDLIVSSFQAASPGGTGLHRPMVEPGFELFDIRDRRHLVASHHLAHALSALSTSGFSDAAVLVCDLGGSTTRNGRDFLSTFAAFEEELTSLERQAQLSTECLSIYQGGELSLELLYREFCVPHNTPDVFIQNVASLYDNVSRMIFGRENAHGQLMALGSMTENADRPFTVHPDEIVAIRPDGGIEFRNNWQHKIGYHKDVLDYAPVAHAVQKGLESALLGYARKAKALSTSDGLVAAGGVFLNILANSRIVGNGLFRRYYVPSAPHDAGIAIGCAYAGWREIARLSGLRVCCTTVDRLGPRYDWRHLEEALHRHAQVVEVPEVVVPATIAGLLQEGQIVARFPDALNLVQGHSGDAAYWRRHLSPVQGSPQRHQGSSSLAARRTYHHP